MAQTGTHIVCAHMSKRSGASFVLSSPEWSETLAQGGTTAKAAGGDDRLFLISPSVDAYVAVGPSPNASAAAGEGASARYLVYAGTTREVLCKKGDKVAWVAAA